MASKTKVFLGIPSMGEYSDFLVHQLHKIEKKYSEQIEFVWPKDCVRRMFHDFARNAICDEFLSSGADVLWFLDSDVGPPDHVLDLITVHGDKWKVAGAPYPVFMRPDGEKYTQVLFTVYEGIKNGGLAPGHIPNAGTAFVDGIATGCLFIKREVFDSLKQPYFSFKFNETTRGLQGGEDLGFCIKMHELGIKFFVDYGMLCKHHKYIDLLDVNNYALDYARKAVDAYKIQIEPQMTAVMKTAYAKGMEIGARKAKNPSGLIIPGR